MKISEIILNEDKEEFLATKFGPQLVQIASSDNMLTSNPDLAKSPQHIVALLKKIDPFNGQNLQWLVNQYVKRAFRLEDANRLKQDIADFYKFRKEIPNKDLLSYKDIGDFYTAVENAKQKLSGVAPVSKAQQEKITKTEGAKVLINTPDFKVIIPETEQAACLYGAGTKWCTAAKSDNQFNTYNQQGPMYIIIAGDKKYQFHVESSQYMTAQDTQIKKSDIDYLSKFPKYKDFINYLITKNYGKYFTDSNVGESRKYR